MARIVLSGGNGKTTVVNTTRSGMVIVPSDGKSWSEAVAAARDNTNATISGK